MMVEYAPSFVRQYKKLSPDLQQEVEEKILLFSKAAHHPSLRVHPLKGRLVGTYSFSVNYAYRVVFEYKNKTSAVLLAVGDHDVYR